MSEKSFPPLQEILPQSGRMRLLDRILAHDERETICSVDVRRSSLFCEPEGFVPMWVGIEYMAQCIAAHGGLEARARGEAPRPGLFLGSRRVRFQPGSLAPERRLEVRAQHLRGDPARPGPLSFRCTLVDPSLAQPLAEGVLNVFGVESIEVLTRGERNE